VVKLRFRQAAIHVAVIATLASACNAETTAPKPAQIDRNGLSMKDRSWRKADIEIP
jgi:hypothetical protein